MDLYYSNIDPITFQMCTPNKIGFPLYWYTNIIIFINRLFSVFLHKYFFYQFQYRH